MAGETAPSTGPNTISSVMAGIGRDWGMLEALLGGTTAMRGANTHFLPKWPQEDTDHYAARLATATLFPAYRRTLSVMAGKPFSRPVELDEDAPAQLLEWAEDIDREGVNLHTFLAEQFEESFYGLAGILVEAPPKPAASETVAQQKARGARPYWVRVQHRQILGYRLGYQNGRRYLTQLRLRDDQLAEDGEWGEKTVERVRVLTPGAWVVYALKDGGWDVVERGATTLDYIPFVPLYGRRKGFMIGLPPLVDLAHLNVKHWQSSSDQDTILHAARVPILFGKMLSVEGGFTVGSSKAVMATDKDADLKWVEHRGEAINAGKESLVHLEDQMVQAGAELLVKRATGGRTATEDSNDAEGNKCELQRMAEAFEDSVNLAMAYTCELGGLDGAKAKVNLFKDFGASTMGDASATLIKDLMVANKLDIATGISELKRRGELDLSVTADQVKDQLVEDGGAGLGMPPVDPNNPDPDPDPDPAKPNPDPAE